MNDPRFVFDTNVSVSASLFKNSVPREALNAARQRGVLLFSDETFAELAEVIRREKFTRYVTKPVREAFLLEILTHAELVKITHPISVCRDLKDNKFLEVAVSGSATHIITGDSDLLVLHPFQGVAILTPQDFLADIQRSYP